MPRRTFITQGGGLLAVVVAVFAGPATETTRADAPGAGRPQALVRATARLPEGQVPRPGATVRIDVTLTVAEGWHINANPAGDPAMIPTAIQVRPGGPGALESIDYPPGVPQAVAGGGFGAGTPGAMIYESGTTIPVRVRLFDLAPGPQTLTLTVKYQACNDRACRPPATLNVPVQLDVAAR